MNIRELREARGLMQKDLAKLIGVAPSTFSQYETGKRQPDISTLQLIARALDVTIDELVGCETMIPKSTGGIWIPVLGRVAAGVPITAVEEILDYEEISLEMARSGECFALQVKGNSMEPRIKEGDVVIVRKQSDVESGDVAVVRINGDEAVVKKVIKKSDSMALVSFNPAYEPRYFSMKEIEELPLCICGKVIELRAKF